MLHALISALASDTTTIASAATCVASVAYIYWKMKGGNLLFRVRKGDDPATLMHKAIFAFCFTYGMLIISMWLAAASGLLFVLSLLAKLFV